MSLIPCWLLILYNVATLVSGNPHYIQLEVDSDSNARFSGSVNSSIEYIFLLHNKTSNEFPSRVTVSSSDTSRDFPLLVVVRQQRQVLSWQLPLLVDTHAGALGFNWTARTLCPHAPAAGGGSVGLIVSLSTASPVNVSFELLVAAERHFWLAAGREESTHVAPSAPKLYFYRFADTNDSVATDTVLLRVASDSDTCMYVSVQNASCPVYDLEHDIRFQGYWETVSRLGGITVPRSKFPEGFFVVLVPLSEDRLCTGRGAEPGVFLRDKAVRLSVVAGPARRDYVTAVAATAGVALAAYLGAAVLLCAVGRRRTPMTMEAMEDELPEDGAAASPVAGTPASTVASGGAFDEDDVYLEEHSSLDETEYDTLAEAASERHVYRGKGALFLSDLARKPPRLLQRKSYLYLWHVLTVAVFYGLPVVQLVVTYQRVLADTGNQDLCYYNSLCAHPLGLLSDFNHVFSNCGYAALGVLFLLLVARRERWHGDDAFDRGYGIPQHHGLFYAMGAALIMEGVLSASYHVCPNHTNFQFDSSFMYVMAVLCMVKIYQNRHPDINATAYATFAVLAAAICLGMLGILDGSVRFWAAFTALHLAACLLLTVQLYYLGCWRLDAGLCGRVARSLAAEWRAGPAHLLRPAHKGRMALLVLGNAANWALAALGLYHHERDFATHLLAILMANTLLYTLFYIVMKLLHRERIQLHAALFIALATITWAAAMYFFMHKSISWALTPAESRQYNQPCLLLDFYDPHDVWHFLSAAAMFFSFMILLTLDDDLSHTHRSRIHVF